MRNLQSCKDIRNNIYIFNNLSDENKEDTLKHISYCSECRSHFKKINQIMYLMNDHVNDQLLIEYAYNNLDLDGSTPGESKLSDAETENIKQHLYECDFCKSKYKEMQSQYIEMNNFWMKEAYPDFKMQPANYKPNLSIRNQQSSISFIANKYQGDRYIQKIMAFAAVILILVVSLFVDWTSPSIADLAEVKDIRIPVAIRGSENNTFYRGIISFNQKNYREAIILFQQYIASDKETNEIDYVHYLLALSYIKSANNIVPIDLVSVDKGISELSLVLSSSKNPNLIENTNWYLAKAYLMKKDILNAARYFKEVIRLNGDRREDAQLILNQLKEKFLR